MAMADDVVEQVRRRARWSDAIAEAEAGDAALLESLLRSDWTIPDSARQWIADRARRLAVKRPGRPAKLGERLLELERRHYAAMTKETRRTYVVDLSEEYGVDIEVLEKMLSGPKPPKVKKKPGRVSS